MGRSEAEAYAGKVCLLCRCCRSCVDVKSSSCKPSVWLKSLDIDGETALLALTSFRSLLAAKSCAICVVCKPKAYLQDHV